MQGFRHERDQHASLGTTVTISSSIFDTLQTENRWTSDGTGYNFAFVMPRAAFPNGDTRYRVEFKFTPVGGEPFYLLHDVDAVSVLSE